jgi:3-oxoacyl-[acyl-carrier-protein] synthase II
MSIYINAIGNISPQKTADNLHFLEEPLSYEGLQMRCIDPGYKDYIPADQIRRMGRIIKMGVAAAKICLKETDCSVPDAIITGTGLGCIEDTEKFLATLIRNNEEFLTPTSFIQSTHNTVGAQIALLLKCHGYNFAYVHRGLSFESALTDAMMRLEAGHEANVLVGGIDELTNDSFAIMQRLGHWKRKPLHSLRLFDDPARGTIAGEGASFFFLEAAKKETSYALLKGVSMLFDPASGEEIEGWISRFLSGHGLAAKDISLVVTGMNGDPSLDKVYHDLLSGPFAGTAAARFKHLCGEYMTANSFGMWLGSMIMKNQTVPEFVLMATPPDGLNHILLWNHYRMTHHSLILLSRA